MRALVTMRSAGDCCARASDGRTRMSVARSAMCCGLMSGTRTESLRWGWPGTLAGDGGAGYYRPHHVDLQPGDRGVERSGDRWRMAVSRGGPRHPDTLIQRASTGERE